MKPACLRSSASIVIMRHHGDLPCHGSQFDVTTGAVQNPPATEAVPSYPVRVDGDNIKIQV